MCFFYIFCRCFKSLIRATDLHQRLTFFYYDSNNLGSGYTFSFCFSFILIYICEFSLYPGCLFFFLLVDSERKFLQFSLHGKDWHGFSFQPPREMTMSMSNLMLNWGIVHSTFQNNFLLYFHFIQAHGLVFIPLLLGFVNWSLS